MVQTCLLKRWRRQVKRNRITDFTDLGYWDSSTYSIISNLPTKGLQQSRLYPYPIILLSYYPTILLSYYPKSYYL